MIEGDNLEVLKLLRKGHAGYVPFVAALFPAFLVLVVLTSFTPPA